MAGEVFTVELNAAEALRALQAQPAKVSRAMVRALNRAGTSGRAEMARRVAKDMGVRVSDAKEAVLLESATATRLAVRLKASKKRRPLFDFHARQVASGVSFRGEGGKRSTVTSAFIASVRAGSSGTHQGVFKRKGKKRLPIYELFGVSIGHVFERHRPAVADQMVDVFDKNLTSELKFANNQ